MSGTKKAVRLGKAARDFNVGISTIVEHLSNEGIEIESSPNTKLEPELYDKLLAAFKSDQELKEKSTSISNRTRPEKKSISLDSTKGNEEEEAPATEEKPAAIDVHELKEEVKKASEEPAEEETPEEVPVEEPVVEEKVEEVAEEKAEDTKKGPKVLGKLDLDKIPGGKGKKAAKKEEKKEEKAEAKEEVVEEKKEAPAEEKPADTPAPDKVIRAEAEKLSGPKVLGKINLPDKPKKKPVASSSDDATGDKRKRKRKRVAKVDVNRPGGGNRKGKGKREAKPELTEAEIQKEIKETLARLSGGKKNKGAKFRRAKRDAAAQRTEEELMKLEEESTILKLTEFVTVSELSTMMNREVSEIISACMSLGIFASINQRLDAETISIIAEEFGFTVEFVSTEVQEAIEVEEDSEEDLVPRAPIVTVMGHVDHGKTSLLDYVRKANVIAGESGGITQHIGAYSVELESGKHITFLDTPGHEAFTAMRARGAQVTDLAIIVVAADDAVMPQTKEAINHAQAAGIPMVFAINKIDRPESNPDRIKEQLSQENILIEEWGGKYQSMDISAKTGLNVNELLEKVLLEAELLDLKANPNKRAHGTVIESELDKGRGYVTTMLVEAGTLRVGDPFVAGQWAGRVKAMYDERGNKIEEAGPATPLSMLGLDGAPNAGDKFNVLVDEKEARSIANRRQVLQREQSVRTQKHITIEEIGRRIALGEFKELNLIVKGDVNGSVEALTDSLQKLSTENVQVNIIHKGVGQIIDSDVMLASASNAIIIGFQVRPSASARRLAENEEIQIRMYSVIYDAINEMKEAMEGLLSMKIEEKVIGTCEIQETFKISKVGTIAGCIVRDGKIIRNNKVRVIREGIVVYDGELGSLKRFKDDVKEVGKGYECGLNVEKFNDIKVGDIIESYEEIEVKQKL